MAYRDKANIELGDVAKDTLTGFTGTVIARTRWLSNCDRLTVQPKEIKDGKPIQAHSFDLPNLEFVKKGKISVLPVVRPADPVELGDVVEDKLTGVKGTAIGHTVWLNGCSRVTVQPAELKDGIPVEASTLDEKDLKVTKRAKPLPAVKTGGPRPEPRR